MSSNGRRFGVLLMLLTVICVAVLARGCGSTRGPDSASPHGANAPAVVVEAQPVTEGALRVPPAGAVADAAGLAPILIGRVILENMDGSESRQVFGRLAINYIGESERHSILDVRSGEFRIEPMAVEHSIQPLQFETDGWIAVPAERQIDLRSGEELRIRVSWSEGVKLSVFSNPLGIELAGLLVVSAADPTGGQRLPLERCPPAGDERIEWHSNGVSPLRLPVATDTAVVWIGAPGHAWSRVAVAGGGGARTVSLDRGADFGVEWSSGREFDRKLVLLVRTRSGEPILRREFDARFGASAKFEGLPEGPFEALLQHSAAGQVATVALTHGSLSGDQPFVWNVTQDTTIAGLDRSVVEVAVRGGDPAMFDAKGSCMFQALDESGSVVASTRRIERELQRHATEPRLTSGLVELPPGRWRIVVSPWNLSREVVTEPGSQQAESFDLGQVGAIEFEVVDESSGAAITSAKVRFGVINSGERALHLGPAAMMNGGALWVVRAPVGRVDVSCSAPGYVSCRSPRNLGAGISREVLRMAKSDDIEIRLTLREGDALFPVSGQDWSGIAVEAPSAGVIVRFAFNYSGTDAKTAMTSIFVSRAGGYRLRLPAALVGGDADEMLEVAASKSPVAELTIQRK